MPYDPDKHHRRSIRLPGYDYASVGAYFVTLCTVKRECLFGDVVGEKMVLSVIGKTIDDCVRDLPNHFENIEIDSAVVMPNHVHLIVVIFRRDEKARPEQDARTFTGMEEKKFVAPGPGTLGTILGTFKASATRRITGGQGHGFTLWQRNYFEKIIRNDRALNAFREYIELNPINWEKDEHNPKRLK